MKRLLMPTIVSIGIIYDYDFDGIKDFIS